MANPILNTDFYKETHMQQYNPNIDKIVSYYTPRMSRTDETEVVTFGIQYFVLKYLIEDFNKNFFERSKKEVIDEYERMISLTLGKDFVQRKPFEELHDLGYLPLKISALPEGTLCPMGCPMIEITNTHPDFAWLVNFIETSMSATLWHMMTSANIGLKYRKIANEWYDKTVENDVSPEGAICDFSMRGQESIESATKSSAAFLLSFNKTATIPAIEFLEKYYGAVLETEIVATGLASTEHSVMCSNFAIDGDEKTFILKLLKDIYPNNSFSMVSDSYDYWNLLSNIISEEEVKDAILNHNGFIGFRGDSGDPVDILCGKEVGTEVEKKGTIELLWDIFGGTINSKGYKVLNPKVKGIYGDSITPDRAKEIYKRLSNKGFASNNVALGMGSFSMQSVSGQPLTRDTYSVAIKTTYCEIDGKPIEVFKNPKTDTGNFKKSQKGCCIVLIDHKGKLVYSDGLTYEQRQRAFTIMHPVFINGALTKFYTLQEIRDKLKLEMRGYDV